MSPNPKPLPFLHIDGGVTALLQRLPLPNGFAARAAIAFAFLLLLLALIPDGKPGGPVVGDGTETALPQAGTIRLRVRASGLIRAEGQRPLFPRVAGALSEVPAAGSEAVVAGQVLARIEDDDYQDALDDAQSRLAAAHAEAAGDAARLAQAQRELRRNQRLYDSDLIPRRELEESRVVLQELQSKRTMQQARVVQAATALARALRDLEACTLRSPLDGLLLSVRARVGMQVHPGEPEPLFLVAPSLERMEIRVSVTEADIGAVQPGQSATFRVQAYPGREFTARVQSVERGGVLRDGVSHFDLLLAADNPDGLLLPGMSAEAEIDAGERPVERQIPLRALLYSPGEKVAERQREEIDRIRQGGLTPIWIQEKDGTVRPVGVGLGIQDRERLELTGEWPYGKEAQVLYRP